MVEVYGKKAHQINAQDPARMGKHTAQSVYGKLGKTSGGKERKKKPSSPREENQTHNPHLTRQGSRPIATFTLNKDPWLQLLYEYNEGIL